MEASDMSILEMFCVIVCHHGYYMQGFFNQENITINNDPIN